MNVPTTAVATQGARDTMPMTSVGMTSAGGNRIAPQNLGEVVKFAEVMSRADIALPKHLRGNPGACMAVALQALDWQMNPFAVASKSYSVNNIIAYEAQLIAAVVNTRSGIKGRLRYEYEGEGANLFCRVTGTLDGMECVYESPTVGSITTKNSPLWKSDVKQQLGYFSARSWARRYCPEVILGVYDRDEAQEIKDVTPPAGTGLASRLSGSSGGFDASTINASIGEAQDEGNTAGEAPLAEDGDQPSAITDGVATEHREPDLIEARKQGQRAAFAGEDRVPPEDALPEEKDAWLEAYAEAEADAERVA